MSTRPYYFVMDNTKAEIISVPFKDKMVAKAHRDELNGGKHNTPPNQKIPPLRYTITKKEL